MKRSLKFVLILVIHTFAFLPLSGQQLKVNADKISELIEQWNSIHNKRADAAFVEVYESELFYYAERVPQAKATLLKKLLFVRNPQYQQRVTGPVRLEVYENGVVKCDFNKEVWKNSGWVSTSMYLLIRYGNHGYWIMGESDYETDKRFGFVPKLGEMLQSKFLPVRSDGHVELHARADLNNSFAINKLIPPTQISLFLIIALIGSGVVVILRNNSTFQNYLSTIDLDEPILDEVTPEETNQTDGDDLHNYNLNQDAFREYLLSLFDPRFFKYENRNKIEGCENQLHFQLTKSTSEPASFTIQYYYAERAPRETPLFSPELLSRIKQAASVTDLYIVIGIGGSPDDPNDIYLLPSKEVKSNDYTLEDLHPYKKYGLFFFSQTHNHLR